MMRTVHLADGNAVLAPDGSQIRELVAVAAGSMVHCALPEGAVSMAVAHATVDEVWYCLAGRGQVWRRREDAESVVDLEPGVALTIECGTHFQFRNTGDEDLRCIIVTMPPWPGAEEGRRVNDPLGGDRRGAQRLSSRCRESRWASPSSIDPHDRLYTQGSTGCRRTTLGDGER